MTVKNLSMILTGVSVVGVGLTGYLSGRAAIKGKDAVTVKEKVLAYGPAVAAGLITSACIVGNSYICNKEIKSLTTKLAASTAAYSALSTQYNKYVQAVTEKVGKEAEMELREQVAVPELKSDIPGEPAPTDDDFKNQMVEFYESYSGTYFDTTMESLYNAIYEANRTFILNGELPFSWWLKYIGADAYIEPGDPEWNGIGWNEYLGESTYGYKWIDFSINKNRKSNGKVYYKITYPFEPHGLDEDGNY